MRLPLIHHPGYTFEWPERHPFPMAKFRALRQQLSALGFDDDPLIDWVTPTPPASTALLRAHTEAWLQTFYLGDSDPKARKRSGFDWSPQLAERTLLEVGGTLSTLRAALETGLACNTAGGTHHAYPDAASGYCLLNDLAVAAHEAMAVYGVTNILIIDCDVHQGDGTAFAFQNDPRVFTCSIHGADNFPFTKRQSDRDIALPRGTDDAAYQAVLEREIPALLDRLQPELVFFDAGADVHAGDRLGHFELSLDGIYRRDLFVLHQCRARSIPVAAVIGGGYDRNLAALAERHAQLFLAARELLRQT
ncbi:histone deacetylase family protein [Kushneria indalinina]|uniref:Acetoin utilization deacetylase AcuC-like enzyme n=1 Tax=Kushneria indalinina DSM 14324 TaxID=1122140 RepID=A0A3D9DSB5_9GAMM|nr:histone deacetylase [Kushneria indalinina]REC93637.1 acetoin utilization deacetylase AcuC-like enzyme [Kushneria indalinina DSM 14324]